MKRWASTASFTTSVPNLPAPLNGNNQAAPPRPFFKTGSEAENADKFSKIKIEAKIDNPCKDKSHPHIVITEKGVGERSKTSQDEEKTFEFPVFPNTSLDTLGEAADLTGLMDQLHTRLLTKPKRIWMRQTKKKRKSEPNSRKRKRKRRK